MAGYQTVAQRNLTCAIRIRERRRELGLTQAEVVRRVNGHGPHLSNQALSAIENGRRLPVGRLPDLAAALECTVSYLLGLTADPDRWAPDADPGRWAPDADPGRWAPDADSGRWAPDAAPEPAAEARDAAPQARGPAADIGRTPPGTNGSPDRAAPSRRSWILGPDVPEAGPPALIPLILSRRP